MMLQGLPKISFRRGIVNMLLLLLAAVLPGKMNAHGPACMLTPIELADRVRVSEVVFEGQIIESQGFMNPEGTMIHTAHLVRVFRVFKGYMPQDFAVIIVQGGVYGNSGLTVTPSLGLKTDDLGLFIASADPMPTPYRTLRAYRPFGTANGFIRYDVENDLASEAFYQYTGIQDDLYRKVERLTGRRHEVKLDWRNKATAQPDQGQAGQTHTPTGIAFTPTTATAGTFTVLTITGSNFGIQNANSRVRFQNANAAPVAWMTPSNLHILSWSDTEIRIIVPNGAGTGQIEIRNGVTNLIGTSVGTLTVPYNIINAELPAATPTDIYHMNLTDLNNAGGITFAYNNTRGSAGNNFAANTDARAAFERALQTWRCATGVNFTISPITTNADYTNGTDTINCVSFDYTGEFITALGVCYSGWNFPAGCSMQGGRTGMKRRIDIVFRHPTDNPNWGAQAWHFLTTPPPANRFDFESVALHELGHAHELDHVVVPVGAGVMRWAIPPATSVRTLTPGDIDGGLWVMARSTNVNDMEACGRMPHQSVLGAPQCQQVMPAGAAGCAIGTNTTSGCAPLTVNFTGNFTGDVPTGFYWDLDNAAGPPTPAKIEYYGRNATHTFNTPGTYTVKMYAGTANGYCQSTVTINVGTSFSATLTPAGPVTVCGSQTLTATNDPNFTYQWFRDGNPVGSNQNTFNATVSGSYTVRVSQGSCVQDLGPVLVTILPPSIGGTASVTPASVCAGINTVTFNLTGQAGTVLRWEYSTDNFVTNTVNVPLSNNPTLVVNNLTQTRQYRALVQNGGCIAVYSSVATITVEPQTVAGSVGPDATVCSGTNTATLNLTGQSGSVIRWESSTDNFATTTLTVPNTNTSLTVNNLTATTWYRAVVQSGNCDILESAAGRVQVDPSPPPIDPISGPATACQLTTSTYSTNNVAGIQYDWTIAPAGPTLNPAGHTVSINWGTSAPGTFTLTVTPRIGGCSGTPRSATVTLNQAVGTPGAITGAGLHCVGQARTYGIAPVPGATTYNWSNSCGAWTGSSNTTSISYTATTVQTCIISVTATGVCGTSPPAQLTVTSSSTPLQPSIVSGPDIVCQNRTESYSVAAVPNVQFNWTINAAQATVTSGQTTNAVTINWGNTPTGNYTITVTPSNACGTGPVRTFAVEVRTLPAQPAPITGSTPLVCQNTSFTYSTAAVPNVNYAWNITPAGPTFTASANSVDVTWPASGVYDISVVPSNFCGNGPARTLRVTLEGQPVANAGPDRTICASSVAVAGSPTANGTWRCFSCPGSAQLVGFGANATLNNIEPGLPYELEYEVRGQACPPSTDRLVILNDAAAAGTITAPGNAVCGGSSVTLQLTGFRGNVLFWEYSTDNGASWTSIASPSSVLSFSPTVNTFFRAHVGVPSGNCPNVTTQPLLQRVVEQPVAVASPAFQRTCRSNASAYGQLPNEGSVSWALESAPTGSAPVVSSAQGAGFFDNLTVPGIYRFRYTVQGEPPCGSDFTVVEVERLPDPPMANAGPDASTCDGTYTLQGNFATNTTMAWAFLAGPVVPTLIPNQNTANVSGMNRPGRYVFSYTIQQPGCPPSTDFVFIDRTNPVTADAGPSRTTCSNSVLLRGNTPPAGGIGTWTVVSHPSPNPPTLQGTGSTVVANLPSVTGQYVFRYTITGLACTPVFDEVTITRDLQPQVPTLSASQSTLCGPTFVQLEAQPHSGTGIWSFISGPSQAFVAGSGLAVTATNLTGVGTYTFRYTVSNACGSAFSEVSVQRSAGPPQVFAGSDQTVCDVSTALLTGSVIPDGGSARWEFIGGPCTAGVVGFGRFATAVSMSCAGNYFFRYTVTAAGSGCPSASDVVKITRTQRPSVANVNGPTTVCGSTVTLTGNIPSVGTGSWSLVSYPGSVPPALNPQSEVVTVSGMNLPGTYVVRWTISNPPCTPSAFDHNVTVGEPVQAGAVSGPTQVCLPNPVTQVLTNYQGMILRWEVSTDGGGAWNPISNTQPALAVQLTQPGQYCYRAVVSGGACGTAFSAINCVSVGQAPAQADAGPDRVTCDETILLTGNLDASAPNRIWTFVAGPTVATVATFSNVGTVSGMTLPGTYCFRYTLENACGEASDVACVEVLPQPRAGTVNGPAVLCRTSPNDAASLVLTNFQGQLIRWEASTDDFASVTSVPNTTSVFTVGNNYPNGRLCVRAVVGQSACNQPPVTSAPHCIQLSNGNYPTPFAGSNFTTCDPNITLTGTPPPAGVTVQWEFLSGPAPATLFSPGTPTTGVSLVAGTYGSYCFRYTLESTGCVPKSSTVCANYVDNQVNGNGSISGSTTVCGQPNSGALVLSGHSGTIVRWESSTDNWVNITPYNNPTNVFNFSNLSQTTQFRAVLANASCPTTYSLEATVVVGQPPTLAQTPASVTVCADQVVLTGNAPTTGSSSWRFVFGPITPNVAGSGTVAFVSGLTAPGAYLFEYTIENPPCAPSTSFTTIQVFAPVVTGAVSGSPLNVCAGNNTGLLTLQGHQGIIVRWESSTDNFGSQITPISNTSPSQGFSNLTQTTWYRAVVRNASCPPAFTQSVQVTVDQPSAGGTASPSQQSICATTGAAVVSVSGHSGTLLRWETSTDNGQTWIPQPNSATSPFTVNQLTQPALVRAVVQNGVCAAAASQAASIQVDEPTIGGAVLGSATVCAGANSGTLALTGQRGSVLRWESSTDNFATATTLNNPTASQVYTNLLQTTAYRAVVQNGSCPPAFSSTVVVAVDNASLPGQLVGSTTVCAGNHAGQIELIGGNATVIRWERSADNFQTFDVVATSGRSLGYANLLQTMQYRVLVQGANCPPAYSNPITIFVQVGAIAGVVSSSASFCQSGSGSVQLTGGYGPIIRWEYSTDNFQQNIVPVSTSNTVFTYNNLTQTTWIRAVQQAGSCPAVFTPAAQIRIDQPPVGGTVSGGTTACNGQATGTLVLTGFSGSVVRWEKDFSPAFTNPQTVNVAASTLTYSETQSVWYRAVVSGGACGLAFSSAEYIWVLPTGVGGAVTGAATVCHNAGSGTLQLIQNVGQVLRWESSANCTFTSNVTTIAQASPQLTYSGLTQTTCYRAVVSSGGVCPPVFSTPALVTVLEEIVVNTVETSKGCNGLGTLRAEATGGNGPFTYSISPAFQPSNPTGLFNNLPTGIYTLTVSDGQCAAQVVYDLDQAPTAPLRPRVTQVTATTALVQWTDVPPGAGMFYTLRYRTPNAPSWSIINNLGLNFFIVAGLLPSTTYEVEVAYRCPNSFINSNFSLPATFTTLSTRDVGLADGADLLRLYPNPSRGRFTLEAQAAEAGSVSLRLTDLQGRVVWTGREEALAGSNSWPVDVAPLAAGVYLLQIEGLGLRRSLKVVLE